jgi:predicted O-methyltransferase YrrM
MIDRALDDIPRGLSLGGGSMSEVIDLVARHPRVRRYVEVGSYEGGSILTLGLRFLNRDIDFYAVESFMGSLGGTVDGWPLPSRSRFEANLARFPRARVRLVPGDSTLAAALFEDASLDFVFIDACHDTPAVLRDIEVWLPKIRPGGILAGDDYGWDSVRAAVDQRFPAANLTPSRWVWWVTAGG